MSGTAKVILMYHRHEPTDRVQLSVIAKCCLKCGEEHSSSCADTWIGLNVVDWIGLAQDRYNWRTLVNSVMNLRVP
jgi:hypothetical protein